MVRFKAWLAVPAFVLAAALSFAVVHQFATKKTPLTPLTPLESIAQVAIPDPAALFSKGSLKVLVVGLDYDYDGKDQETSAHSRSDIIMAINLDFAKRRILELSVPRDMVATMPNGKTAKINEAQSEGGINESQSVVSQWLGIPGFDRYVVLRIDTMKDLINALGGVDVAVKTSDCLRYKTGCTHGSIDYDDSWGHLHVHMQEGMQHLSGDQAVGYARFRHDWCSDPCRIMRQQQVVGSIIQRIKGNDLNTLAHIVPLIDVVRKDVDTNFTAQEELSIANAFRSMGPKDLTTAQVPYTSEVDLPDYGSSIVADQAEKKRLVRTMLYDVPSPVSQQQ
jgi:LCP family protein required for cell wall assembly